MRKLDSNYIYNLYRLTERYVKLNNIINGIEADKEYQFTTKYRKGGTGALPTAIKIIPSTVPEDQVPYMMEDDCLSDNTMKSVCDIIIKDLLAELKIIEDQIKKEINNE